MEREAPLVPYAYTDEETFASQKTEGLYNFLKRNFFERSNLISNRVDGLENLDTVRRLLDQGKIVATAYKHLVLADAISGIYALEQNGAGDLAENCIYVIRISYVDGWLKNYIPRLVRVLPVVSHKVPRHQYPNRDEINGQAIQTAQNLPDGFVLAVAPVGGRDPEGKAEARTGTADFWHGRGERLVLPAAVAGTNMQWRPKGIIGLPYFVGIPYFVRGGRTRHTAHIVFGEPIPVEKIDEVAYRWARGDENVEKHLRVDLVMGVITKLDPIENDNEEYAKRLRGDLNFAKAVEELYKPHIL